MTGADRTCEQIGIKSPSAPLVLSVIAVSFNTRSMLKQCLESVEAAKAHLPIEIVVVDNASLDGSADTVETEFPDVKLIRNSHNVGFARACNQGIRVSSARYVLLLNTDVMVFPDTLRKMVEFMNLHSTVGISACRLLNEDGSVQASVRDFPSLRGELFSALLLDRVFVSNAFIGAYLKTALTIRESSEVDQVSGAFLMIRREAVQQIGLLDERFFIYYEDVDWCLQTKRAGWSVMYVPECCALHSGGGSANQFNAFSYVEGVRSKILYYRKHYGLTKTLFVQLLVMIEILMRMLVWLAAQVGRTLRLKDTTNKGWSPSVAARICSVAWFPLHTKLSATRMANA